ncbi:MAG: response regulator [Salaquimonas sp.]
MKIFMIADDSPVIRKVARRLIEDLGFVVVEAENASQAQALCAENMPDGILIDWDMPGMTSLELIEWLRHYPQAEKIKMLYCTSEVLVSEMTRAKRAGAHGFLLKPFNRQMISNKLKEVGLVEAEQFAA